jgi:hypothetical protein
MSLWASFATIINLEIVFRQQGENANQARFFQILTNIYASPTIEDWEARLVKDLQIPLHGRMWKH